MATLDRDDPMRATLALMAPGTALRDGLERILRGNTAHSSFSVSTARWSRSVRAASRSTSNSPPPGCANYANGWRGGVDQRRVPDRARRRTSHAGSVDP